MRALQGIAVDIFQQIPAFPTGSFPLWFSPLGGLDDPEVLPLTSLDCIKNLILCATAHRNLPYNPLNKALNKPFFIPSIKYIQHDQGFSLTLFLSSRHITPPRGFHPFMRPLYDEEPFFRCPTTINRANFFHLPRLTIAGSILFRHKNTKAVDAATTKNEQTSTLLCGAGYRGSPKSTRRIFQCPVLTLSWRLMRY